ncbi:hypothetical protein BDV96DRAFT_385459 [Lophiotrema nucula]|uniref:DUF202 domain-containing protein n=1 Tax=Lophiotrema nucula TaxID=690887 RepID=A0A6A5ZHP6_9PLEO|nr:hypothetical protein BDV96DRAFT_385459 [Lophiotrema nucula]
MNETNSPPSRLLPLELPRGVLHGASSEPHPDSEEAVRRESIRTAQELSPIGEQSSSEHAAGIHIGQTGPRARGSLSIRPLSSGTSRRSSRHSHSEVSTAPDSQGPEGYHVRRYRLRRQVPHWYDPIVKFWTTHVSLTIDEGSHRDHLALERTFLGYLRTSLAFAMSGVIIAQLFRLQHSLNPNPSLGFFVLGIPLAASFICFGMVVLFFGAFRFWRQQQAMVHGKIHSGGWDIAIIMGGSIVLCLAAFILVTAIDIDKSYL